MRLFKKTVLAFLPAFFLAGCDDLVAGEKEPTPQARDFILADGEYTMSAVSFEGKLNETEYVNTAFQLQGSDYTWSLQRTEKGRYSVIATGQARLALEQFPDYVIDCAGSRDEFSFKVSPASGDLTDQASRVLGCTQGLIGNAAKQPTLTAKDASNFVYSEVWSGGLDRIVVQATFKK